jgi:hypothetical protein
MSEDIPNETLGSEPEFRIFWSQMGCPELASLSARKILKDAKATFGGEALR